MTLAGWLDARDGESIARAWAALDKTQLEVGAPGWLVSLHGAAHFAAGFLDWPLERVAWIAGEAMPAPIFDVNRTTPRCVLDQALDRADCYESFTIREVTEGHRGIQYITVACRYDDGTREGGGTATNVVRVFDRRAGRAASIAAGSRHVATIGDVDLAALDLFDHVASFGLTAWTIADPDGVRGILAQLATEIDAESGPRAVHLVEKRFIDSGWVRATLHGLPWGWRIEIYVSDSTPGTYGNVNLRLPLAAGQAVMARLAGVPDLALS